MFKAPCAINYAEAIRKRFLGDETDIRQSDVVEEKAPRAALL